MRSYADLVRFIKATGLRRIELAGLGLNKWLKTFRGDACIYIFPKQAKGGGPMDYVPYKRRCGMGVSICKRTTKEGKKNFFRKRWGNPQKSAVSRIRAVFAERKYTEDLKTHATGGL